MRKLNLLGKLVFLAIVVFVLFGAYSVAKSFSKSGAEDVVSGFATAIKDKDYSKAFDLLASEIQKAGSKSALATRLAEKYSNSTLELKELILEKGSGYAIFFIKEKAEYLTIPLIKEGSEWKINYFSNEAKCVNKCTTGIYCKDNKVLVECKDADGDGCTEEISKTCEFSCSENKCTAVQENFILKIGDSIITFPTKIILADIDPEDGTATLEVGYDIYVFARDQTKTIKDLSITLTGLGKDSINLKIKEVK